MIRLFYLTSTVVGFWGSAGDVGTVCGRGDGECVILAGGPHGCTCSLRHAPHCSPGQEICHLTTLLPCLVALCKVWELAGYTRHSLTSREQLSSSRQW